MERERTICVKKSEPTSYTGPFKRISLPKRYGLRIWVDIQKRMKWERIS